MTRLEQIEARERTATKGPWRNEHGQRGSTVWASVSSTGSMQIASMGHAEFDNRNADFTAHAREDIPWLLDQLRKAEDEIEQACSTACDLCRKKSSVRHSGNDEWHHGAEYCFASPIRFTRLLRQQESNA